MTEGFRKGKLPKRFEGMADEEILSLPVQYSTDTVMKEINGQITVYINHYFDTDLAAAQIIRKIERLEKALDKACEVLEEVYVPCCDSDIRRHNHTSVEWKEWCIGFIDNQPKISLETKTSDWIPCSERLPEKYKSVLVTVETQGGNACYVSERFERDGEACWSALCGRKPLAWMPLPEPYKGE